MGQPKVYEVSFMTKRGGVQGWGIHLEARSAKAAIADAKAKWAADGELNVMHPFGMMARVVPPAEDDYPPNVFFRY